jgi:GGDEF domain-containing protein
MTDRRTVLGLVPGLIGLGLGVAALVLDRPAFGLIAGVCAVVAGIVAGRPTARPTPEAVPEVVPARRRTDGAELVEDIPSASVAEPDATEVAVGDTKPVAELPAELSEVSEVSDAEVEPVEVVDGAGQHADATRKTETVMTSPITDSTGLFSEDYFHIAVETRVSAARRHLRPVAVVLFDVVKDVRSGSPTRVAPEPVVKAIRTTLREADTACRLADGRFGFVLEDTPEDGAIWTVERLRRALTDNGLADPDAPQTRWAGIACYPAHAFSASETLAKAQAAFDAARDWPQDRIEVATATD